VTRLVLDTNVVVSALLWNGPPRLLLEAADKKQIKLFTSVPLLVELADVLHRRKFRNKIAASSLAVDEIVSLYAVLTTVVRPVAISLVSADPDDDVVLGTALAASADFLVSGDSHLLNLKSFQGISLMNTNQAIERILQR